MGEERKYLAEDILDVLKNRLFVKCFAHEKFFWKTA